MILPKTFTIPIQRHCVLNPAGMLAFRSDSVKYPAWTARAKFYPNSHITIANKMSDGVEKDLYTNHEHKVITEIKIERIPAVRRKKRSKDDSFVIYLDYIYHYQTNCD